MDVLSNTELKRLIDTSRLYYKYNETIDRESAYEILNEKIEAINKKEAVEEKKEKASKSTRRSTSKSTRMNPILKVVTSATFIRGVLGILKRVM